MLGYFTLIVVCQLAGEFIVALTGLPLPGPVAGMAILFAGLVIRRGVPADLGKVGDALLGNLSLLFVPAGAGVMLHVSLLGTDWLPISASLIVSTLATVAVTALVMRWLSPSGQDRGE